MVELGRVYVSFVYGLHFCVCVCVNDREGETMKTMFLGENKILERIKNNKIPGLSLIVHSNWVTQILGNP